MLFIYGGAEGEGSGVGVRWLVVGRRGRAGGRDGDGLSLSYLSILIQREHFVAFVFSVERRWVIRGGLRATAADTSYDRGRWVYHSNTVGARWPISWSHPASVCSSPFLYHSLPLPPRLSLAAFHLLLRLVADIELITCSRLTPLSLHPLLHVCTALLSAVLPYGPTIAEHLAMDAGFDPNAVLPTVRPLPPSEDGHRASLPVADAPTTSATAAEVALTGIGLDDGSGEEEEGGDDEATEREDADLPRAAAADGPPASAPTAAPRGGVSSGEGGVLPVEVLRSLMAALARLDDWFAKMEAGEVPRGYITLTVPGEMGATDELIPNPSSERYV